MEKDGPTFPGGVQLHILYKPIDFVIFQGAGVRPLPPPLDPCVASLTGYVHTSSWPKDIP